MLICQHTALTAEESTFVHAHSTFVHPHVHCTTCLLLRQVALVKYMILESFHKRTTYYHEINIKFICHYGSYQMNAVRG